MSELLSESLDRAIKQAELSGENVVERIEMDSQIVELLLNTEPRTVDWSMMGRPMKFRGTTEIKSIKDYGDTINIIIRKRSTGTLSIKTPDGDWAELGKVSDFNFRFETGWMDMPDLADTLDASPHIRQRVAEIMTPKYRPPLIILDDPISE